MGQNYKQFVDKLNSYIRKFYLYRLLRGIILFFVLLLAYFCCIAGLEYFNYFDPKIKVTILIFTASLIVIILFRFILVPLAKLVGIGKRLSYVDISFQLQKTYPEIKDKLINIVELANESDTPYSSQLQKASIDQKISELRIFQFSDAIQFKNLKTVLLVLLSVLFIVLNSVVFWPALFTESSARLIHFQQRFEKPAPFKFELLNKDMKVVSGESVELRLRCIGNELPAVMYVNISGTSFMMEKEEDVFTYNVKNVNSSISVYFTDKRYISEIFRITVLNKPFISAFTVEVIPPQYTGLSREIFQNIGDLKLVTGSKVIWTFKTADTDTLALVYNDSTVVFAKREENTYVVDKHIYSNSDYHIFLKNAELESGNNLNYKIQVTSDLFPEIKVVQVRDTLDFKTFHFKGHILDDYGFNSLDFNLSVEGKDSVFAIPVVPFLLNQDFYYSFNFESVKNLGKSFKYFFSVSDNDNINRFKRSISETFSFYFPEYQDIVLKEINDMSALEQLFQKSTQLAGDIQEGVNDLKQKQINSELSDWEKFKTIKDIVAKKNELENILKQITQQNKDANNFIKSFSEDKQEILKKQQEIEELLDEVFGDDLKKLFEEFNELAKQFDMKKFEQVSNQMNLKMEDLSKQLEKNMLLLKKMKVEQKAERIILELKKILSAENEAINNLEKNIDLGLIKKSEEENSLRLNDLNNEYQQTLELNKGLEKPLNLFSFEKEFSELKLNFSKILNELEKRNRRKSGNEIKNNVKSLEQLIFAMDQMLKSSSKKQNEENIEDLKQILGNLILLSFSQEKVLDEMANIDFSNPKLKELKIVQKNLGSQVVFIEDSLYALAKRTPEISAIINREMEALQVNTGYVFDYLEAGNVGGSRIYQQYSITSANNLALFLSEALENIKKMQNSLEENEGDCDKPGGKSSKPGMSKLKDSQQSIKEQLQQMIDQMKKGDVGKMSKSIGQTLAQQEIMQQLIREMLNGNSVGSKAQSQLKAIDQLLEQSKKELINRSISNELINRQNLILSKLLDAEKSEIERDFDDKRESKTAVKTPESITKTYFEYNGTLKNENEKLNRQSFKLRSFYDQKYNQFVNKVK